MSRRPSAPRPGDGDDESAAGSGDSSPRASRRGSALIAAGILLAKVAGLARERALSHFLGRSFAADAFTAAFRIPNVLQHLLGEGVLSASFIPVYSRLLAEGREEEAGRVAGAIVGLLALVAGVLALVGILLAEPLTALVAAGFRGRQRTFELTVTLVRIMFPGVGFLVLSAWCLGVLNSHRRFFLSYVAPVILNVVQIGFLVGAALYVLGGDLGLGGPGPRVQASLVTWLAVGTVVGGLAQFLAQLLAVRRLNRGLRPSLRLDLPGVRSTVRAFVPIVSARGVVQLSTYVQVFLASFLAAGALATLRYAQMLYLIPISLFGMSVAAAELPELSRAGSVDVQALRGRLQEGLGRIATFVVPTALGYLMIGDLVVATVFQTGEFGRLDTVAVWVVLGGYALGLLASTSSRLLQSALYGVGDARTPARIAMLRVAVSSGLGVVLMLQFDRLAVTPGGVVLLGALPALGPLPEAVRDTAATAGLARLGAAGLALGSGVAAWLEYALLRRGVRRAIGPTTLAGGELRPVLLAALAAGLVAATVRPLVAGLSPVPAGILAVAVTATVYLAVAAALGSGEVRAILASVRRMVGRRVGSP